MTAGASARLRFWVAVAILCAPVLVLGIQRTRGLDWPDDPDLFRESTLAQTLANGHLLDDPYYLGEWTWYPPLVPAIVAGLSRITGSPVQTVYAQAGAYLNILAPIFLAALVARCFGSLASLVAVTAFLYQIPRGRTGAGPFYSTLLYSGNFAPALFFLTLLAYVALAEKHRLRYVLTGLLLGLTFLAHAGPFLVLAVFFMVGFAREATRDPREAFKRYALLFAMAALAAAPQLVSIVGHYHLHILNPVPMQWTSLASTWPVLRRQMDRYTLAACVALVVLWVRGPREGKWVVSGWLASAIGLVGYSFAAAACGWPPVVPRHHLVFYVKVAQPVLIGYGVSALWSGARQWIDRSGLMAWPRSTLTRGLTQWVATTGGALLAVLVLLPNYARCTDGSERTHIIPDSILQSGLDAYRWMRSTLRSDDVVLATDDRALMVVGLAGGKVVAIDGLFSNLYVDWVERVHARDDMFSALRRGDEPAFEALADEYSVTFVLWVYGDGPSFDHTPFRSLAVAFDNRTTKIYRRTAARGRRQSAALEALALRP